MAGGIFGFLGFGGGEGKPERPGNSSRLSKLAKAARDAKPTERPAGPTATETRLSRLSDSARSARRAQTLEDEAAEILDERPTDPVELFLHYGEWLPVTSSNVAAASYDAQGEQLTIEYKDGSFYQYHPVALATAKAFTAATSKGKWVWDNLRVRGTVYGYQVPYTFLSGPSKAQRKWMRSRASRRLHGMIGPKGFG